MAGAPGHSPNLDYFSLCVVWLSLDPSPSSCKARMLNQVKFFRIKDGKNNYRTGPGIRSSLCLLRLICELREVLHLRDTVSSMTDRIALAVLRYFRKQYLDVGVYCRTENK